MNERIKRRAVIGCAATAATLLAAEFLIPNFNKQLIETFGSSSLKDKSSLNQIVLGDSSEHGTDEMDQHRRVTSAQNGSIVKLDLGSGKATRLVVPIMPHGFAFASSKQLISATQKWGERSVIVDRGLTKVIRVINAPEGISFSGHSQFLNRDQTLILSGENREGSGEILIFDIAQDFKLTKRIKSARHVHELKVVENGRTLIALNGSYMNDKASDGGLQYIDCETGKLQEAQRTAAPASHILPIGNRQYIAHGTGGKTAPLSVHFVDWAQKQSVALTDSADFGRYSLTGEALSSGSIDADHVVIFGPRMQVHPRLELSNKSHLRTQYGSGNTYRHQRSFRRNIHRKLYEQRDLALSFCAAVGRDRRC